ncbi:hypothetical protein ACFL2O_06935 [Thermodesulfobacteriota bacterium]
MFELVDKLLLYSFWIALISGIAMQLYLVANVYSFLQIQFQLGLTCPFVYRDHTKKHKGRTGIWYYTFFISAALIFIAGFIELWVRDISPARWEIKLVVILAFFFIVPPLIFAIYKISKEKYI